MKSFLDLRSEENSTVVVDKYYIYYSNFLSSNDHLKGSRRYYNEANLRKRSLKERDQKIYDVLNITSS